MDQPWITESILKITLEIIHLMTGEDLIVVKKPGDSAANSPTMEVDVKKNEEKVLELANNIIQLLTGQVIINTGDVAIYFTLEEWDYLIKNQHLYRDVMQSGSLLGSLGGLKCRNRKRGIYQANLSSNNFIEDIKDAKMNLDTKCFRTQKTSTSKQKSELYVKENPVDIANDKPGSLHSNHINEISLSSNIRDSNIHTTIEQTSICISQDAALWDKVKPPERNRYIPTDHVLAEYTTTYTKDESTSYKENYFTDLYRSTERTTPLIEKSLQAEGNINLNKSAATEHIQANISTIKEEPGLWDNEYSTGTATYTSVPQIEYKTNPIKERFPVHKGFIIFTNTNAHTLVEHNSTSHKHHKAHATYTPPEGEKKQADVHSREKIKTGIFAKILPNLSIKKCKDCDQSFNSSSAYTNHQRSSTNHNCSYYQKHVISNVELLKQPSTSSEKNPLNCSEYGKCFSSDEKLVKHQWDQFNTKKFSCSKCGKHCISESELLTHQKIHTSTKMSVGSDCGKVLTQRVNLVKHMRSHPDGKYFFYKFDIIPQKKLHQGKKYTCSECGKYFTSDAFLIRHQKCHLAIKPFSCSECGKCFKRNGNLLKHCSTHTK
ncbi:oocyte zinc finger -like [Pelobates cultripes]|uniref:Oocyte zinc finger -like n=2 Tax=Pelobates cultripes TaxID=61616 RepID=A0AAD1WTB5_PELCU|nr:oocyte zinc finger -like [Pelobates cultripes]